MFITLHSWYCCSDLVCRHLNFENPSVTPHSSTSHSSILSLYSISSSIKHMGCSCFHLHTTCTSNPRSHRLFSPERSARPRPPAKTSRSHDTFRDHPPPLTQLATYALQPAPSPTKRVRWWSNGEVTSHPHPAHPNSIPSTSARSRCASAASRGWNRRAWVGACLSLRGIKGGRLCRFALVCVVFFTSNTSSSSIPTARRAIYLVEG